MIFCLTFHYMGQSQMHKSETLEHICALAMGALGKNSVGKAFQLRGVHGLHKTKASYIKPANNHSSNLFAFLLFYKEFICLYKAYRNSIPIWTTTKIYMYLKCTFKPNLMEMYLDELKSLSKWLSCSKYCLQYSLDVHSVSSVVVAQMIPKVQFTCSLEFCVCLCM